MCPSETEASERTPGGGDKLGPYTILEPLGAGGMGVVYPAPHERLGRDVAIKVVRPGLLANESARIRFRKEALALGKLNHPNIATVYDVGVQDGSDYLVLEFVAGETLRDRLDEGALPAKEILSLAGEIAAALEEAHEQGVVHRDLKPANLMITSKGHAKILDFGLAKLLAPPGADDITQPFAETAGVIGTPPYMAPEHAEGRAIDSRTGLWSLGVVLYESLGGRTPFRGNTGLAILRSITQDTPLPLRKLRADVPMEAERIVARALEKNVDRRYESASEMARYLAAACSQLSPPATAAGMPAGRLPTRYLGASALLLLLLAASGAWLYHRSERRRWAREEAIPGALKLLADDRQLAAFQLLKDAERWLPGDPQLARITAVNSHTVSVDSTPAGATVDMQDYLTPEMPWIRLGVTPLKNVRIPDGYFRWRVSKADAGRVTAAPLRSKVLSFDLRPPKDAPGGMVLVTGDRWFDMIAFMGWLGPYTLPPYYIDPTEVTNREYQQFVDVGGYSKRQYWEQAFVRDGRGLSWD